VSFRTNTRPKLSAQVFYWEDKILWIGRVVEAKLVNRYATTLFLSLDDDPITIGLENGQKISGRGVLVGPRSQRHQTIVNRDVIAMIWEQQGFEAQALLHELVRKPIQTVVPENISRIKELVAQLNHGRNKRHIGAEISGELSACVASLFCDQIRLDTRILRAANILRAEVPSHLDGECLAKKLDISLERLRHLFSEQMGVSLINYLLWSKLRRTFLYINTGCSATEVALECGFSDLSHMTRTFRNLVGITPTIVLEGNNIEAIHC